MTDLSSIPTWPPIQALTRPGCFFGVRSSSAFWAAGHSSQAVTHFRTKNAAARCEFVPSTEFGRGDILCLISLFQFESFMMSSITSCLCALVIPRVLSET